MQLTKALLLATTLVTGVFCAPAPAPAADPRELVDEISVIDGPPGGPRTGVGSGSGNNPPPPPPPPATTSAAAAAAAPTIDWARNCWDDCRWLRCGMGKPCDAMCVWQCMIQWCPHPSGDSALPPPSPTPAGPDTASPPVLPHITPRKHGPSPSANNSP
ncbi:hypothetical protein VTJ49DRAFT_4185 [Mycothermus thermophilus]|uniref:Uncharacterized protein n=1 Tax=Humicola insolens TaxID=85995 RepID=A0ABR3V6D5_HUMIN